MSEPTFVEIARRMKGLTAEEMASKMGMSKPNYLRKEHEPERLTIAEANKLKEIVGADGEAFINKGITGVNFFTQC